MYLVIPIIIGIAVGLYFGQNNILFENDEVFLTNQKLIENGSPIFGDPSAQITILEFGDYQCSFCFKFHGTSFKTIQNEYIDSGKVKLVFKDFPVNGPDSILAAEASHCANDQGKYWDYHNILYNNWNGERTGWVTRASLSQFADIAEINVGQFNTCLDEQKYHQRVLDMQEFAREVGISATPSFLIFNDEKVIMIRGNQPIDVFRQAINEL